MKKYEAYLWVEHVCRMSALVVLYVLIIAMIIMNIITTLEMAGLETGLMGRYNFFPNFFSVVALLMLIFLMRTKHDRAIEYRRIKFEGAGDLLKQMSIDEASIDSLQNIELKVLGMLKPGIVGHVRDYDFTEDEQEATGVLLYNIENQKTIIVRLDEKFIAVQIYRHLLNFYSSNARIKWNTETLFIIRQERHYQDVERAEPLS